MKSALPFRMSLEAVDPVAKLKDDNPFVDEDSLTAFPFGYPVNRNEVSDTTKRYRAQIKKICAYEAFENTDHTPDEMKKRGGEVKSTSGPERGTPENFVKNLSLKLLPYQEEILRAFGARAPEGLTISYGRRNGKSVLSEQVENLRRMQMHSAANWPEQKIEDPAAQARLLLNYTVTVGGSGGGSNSFSGKESLYRK